MDTILQRVCWNNRGWRLPSGETREAGFPSEERFGHEEWNFQLEDDFEGNVYGYMYTRPSAQRIEQGSGKFRVVFFAIHPDTKEWITAGIYHSAELVPYEDYDGLYKHFGNKGIFERRTQELCAASSEFNYRRARSEVRKSVSDGLLTVRCPLSEIQQFPSNIPLRDISGSQNVSWRFRMFTYLKTPFSLPKAVPPTQPPKGNTDLLPDSGRLIEDAYYRENASGLKIIIPRHKKLSNNFADWLLKQHRIQARQEHERVDIKFSFDGVSVLVELKVCYGVGTTKSIREALGQLLEYNFYAGREEARIWMVVLDEKPNEHDCNFIDVLRRQLSRELVLGWLSEDGFQFHPAWP